MLELVMVTLLYVRNAGERNGAVAAVQQEKALFEPQPEDGVNGEWDSRVLLSHNFQAQLWGFIKCNINWVWGV